MCSLWLPSAWKHFIGKPYCEILVNSFTLKEGLELTPCDYCELALYSILTSFNVTAVHFLVEKVVKA